MKNNENELNLDELENVTGGLQPNYPTGIRNGALPKSKFILNNMDNFVQAKTNAELRRVCPTCNIELKIDYDANVMSCTQCGYSKSLDI